MNQLVIGLVFLAAFVVAVRAGMRWAFVAVYLPAMVFLNQLPLVDLLPHIPLSATTAPLWAIVFALPFRGERVRLRVCSIDVVACLLLISSTLTGWTNEYFETGINTFRTDLMAWIFPYFMARVVFQDWRLRRAALWVIVACMAGVSALAAVEARFAPYFYLHLLRDTLRMGNHIQTMAYYRFGFNRVSGVVEHPIYFGNMCVVILGMVAVLARTSGVRLSNKWVITTLAATVCCVVVSVSWTPYLGLLAGTGMLLVIRFVPFARLAVLPMALAVAGVLIWFTLNAALNPLPNKPDTTLGGSMWTRQLIIHQSWSIARNAGWFGFGLRPDFADLPDAEDFDLSSVDNSYIQFAMTRGWCFLSLWISIGILFAWRATRAFAAVRDKSQVFPLAVATATCLGLMVSMYTVWAGALYTTVWFIMLGLSNTLIDQVIAARDGVPVVPTKVPPRGFPVAPGRGWPSSNRPVPGLNRPALAAGRP